MPVQLHIEYLHAKVGHLNAHIVHDIEILVVDSLEFLEYIRHKDDRYYVQDHYHYA